MTITNARTGEKITVSKDVIRDLKLTFICEMKEAIVSERWATAKRSAYWVDACERALQDYPDTESYVEYVDNKRKEVEVDNKIQEKIDAYKTQVVTDKGLTELEMSDLVDSVKFEEHINDYKEKYFVRFVNGETAYLIVLNDSSIYNNSQDMYNTYNRTEVSVNEMEEITKSDVVESVLYLGKRVVAVETKAGFNIKVKVRRKKVL